MCAYSIAQTTAFICVTICVLFYMNEYMSKCVYIYEYMCEGL